MKQTPALSSKASAVPAAPVSHASEPSQPLPTTSASASDAADVVIELPDQVADAGPRAAVCAAVMALAKQSPSFRVVQYVHSSAQQTLTVPRCLRFTTLRTEYSHKYYKNL